MSWDLFSSASADRKPGLNETANEDVARRVAARQADAGFLDDDGEDFHRPTPRQIGRAHV